jgi:hypothetical protein
LQGAQGLQGVQPMICLIEDYYTNSELKSN